MGLPDIEPQPEKRAQISWKQDVAEQRIADTEMGHDRTTGIAGKEHGSKDRSWRERVEDRADERVMPIR